LFDNLEPECFNKIEFFKYSVNERELRVDDIFLRHYNQEGDQYKPQNSLMFASKIMKKLKEYTHQRYMSDLSTIERFYALELVNAFKTLIKKDLNF